MKELLQLDHMLLHNPLQDWLIAAAIVFGTVLLAALLKRQLIARLSVAARHSERQGYAATVKMVQASKLWLVAIVAVEFGSQVFLQCGIWLTAVLDFWIVRSRNLRPDAELEGRSIDPFSFLGRLILWTVLLLLVLDNLGVNITTLVTSLGVGGIAVALAVQNILGDLFAALSILTDKPFVIGDAIGVDNLSGTVEHIGLKTTRIRSATGEQLVMANSDMIKARLRNYKRMHERCITFGFSVPFGTAADRLEKIPALVRGIIEGRDKLRFDRAHFKDLSGSAYVFEVVYWVTEPNYLTYMDAQQAINLALVRAFDQEGVQLSYPPQTLTIDSPASLKAAAGPAAKPGQEKAGQDKTLLEKVTG
jgi:small-conductance mechanosensitive channel